VLPSTTVGVVTGLHWDDIYRAAGSAIPAAPKLPGARRPRRTTRCILIVPADATTTNRCLEDEIMTVPPTEETVEATFAFVDLAGFTAMTETHGDAEAVSIVRTFRDRAVDVLQPGDELVKTIGDAVMLRFPTPEAAIVALRRLLQRELVVQDAVLLPRAGAHHGRAVIVDGDYYGAAVNLAARVAGQAHGGQLLVTDRAAMAARDLGAIITHVGSVKLRNVSQSIDVYDVRVSDTTQPVVTDPVCQMRVPTTGESAIVLDWSGRRFHFCGLPCLSLFAGNPDTYLERESKRRA
jgi:adenylate cyclase